MSGTEDRLDRSTIVALIAMALAVLIVANDFTAFSVALPAMEKDLDSDLSTIQWVVNAYGLVFGVMIVTGGRLADLFGRRTIFFAGAGIFAGFSLLGGVGQSDIWVIVCRALMGIGGAMMFATSLALIAQEFAPNERGTAFGLWGATTGFAVAVGPLVGGALTQGFGWEWGEDKRPAEAPRFNLVLIVFLVIALAVGLLGIDPLQLTLYGSAFTALVLPIALAPFLVLMNDPDYLGRYTNSRFTNVATVTVLVVASVVALVSMPLLIVSGG